MAKSRKRKQLVSIRLKVLLTLFGITVLTCIVVLKNTTNGSIFLHELLNNLSTIQAQVISQHDSILPTPSALQTYSGFVSEPSLYLTQLPTPTRKPFPTRRPTVYPLATSSSYLQSDTNRYYADNLRDYMIPETAWCEGVEGDGIEEYVHVHIGRGEQEVNKIAVFNGLGSSKTDYYANNRIKRVEIATFPDEYTKDPNLTIEREFQDIYGFQIVNLERDVRISNIRFTIKSVYPGSTYHDTCLSAIQTNPDTIEIIELANNSPDTYSTWEQILMTPSQLSAKLPPPATPWKILVTRGQIYMGPYQFATLYVKPPDEMSWKPVLVSKNNADISEEKKDQQQFYFSKRDVLIPSNNKVIIRTDYYQHHDCKKEHVVCFAHNNLWFTKKKYYANSYYHDENSDVLTIRGNPYYVMVGFSTYTSGTAILSDGAVKPYLTLYDYMVASIE